MSFSDYFKNKRVTVMGLGLLGRGIGDARYIAEAGAKEVVVTDLKTETELASSIEMLRDLPNIRFVLDGHKLADFENVDMVLVSAGVPMDSEYLRHARKAGVPLMQSAALFAKLANIPIIGITGTRGKSTVTHMIHHVLTEVTGEKVLLGGNVRGVSNLQLLNEVKEDSLAVMELDSWQLQGFGWASISPQIAVFTNFMEDHLNYYTRGGKTKEEAMDLYFEDKAQIFLHQEESGVFITTPEVFTRAQKLNGTLGQEVVLADLSILPEDMLLAMPGEHNRLNASLAYLALKATGLEDEEIFDALSTFRGVEGRLEYIGVTDEGVGIYNDNNATTPQATTMGLKAVGDTNKKNVILIAGGADKNIDISSLVEAITLYCKEAILIPGNGTDKLVTALADKNIVPVLAANLKEAVEKSLSLAEAGNIILFSPAFASFAQYKNEYERNDEFLGLVKQYVDN
ncbi:MAG: UDP-N-acetylmuramoyl-L-alanine--D-glutamate ligase [Candidatus Pacebacteria bacterium]|nr:UDP-N-acetylmuramoyl-L-alanine--D-glutamate ligase [Candidatus Paceibacterota bacterium]